MTGLGYCQFHRHTLAKCLQNRQQPSVVDLVHPLMSAQIEIHLECSKQKHCCALANMSHV
jgi:hypothetical protein